MLCSRSSPGTRDGPNPVSVCYYVSVQVVVSEEGDALRGRDVQQIAAIVPYVLMAMMVLICRAILVIAATASEQAPCTTT
jgi:hypothetical protein